MNAVSSGKLLLVLYQLVKDNVFSPLQSDVLNRIAASLSKRKPKFNITEPNLNNIVLSNKMAISSEFAKMIKDGGDNNVEVWLDFISLWKTEDEAYRFAVLIPASLSQVKKVVSIKTVLRLGCD